MPRWRVVRRCFAGRSSCSGAGRLFEDVEDRGWDEAMNSAADAALYVGYEEKEMKRVDCEHRSQAVARV